MHVCTLAHAIGHVWRSEVNLTESFLSLHHHAGPRLSSSVSIDNPFMHRVTSLAPVWVLVQIPPLVCLHFQLELEKKSLWALDFFQSIMLQLMVGSNILWLGLSGGIPMVQSKASGPPPASAVCYSRGFQVEGTWRVISAERQP